MGTLESCAEASNITEDRVELGRLTRLGLGDTLAFLTAVALPTFNKGVLIRRRAAVAAAERLALDRRAVLTMHRLRQRHGDGPLLIALPFRRQIVLLDPRDARQVLDNSPDPFSPASSEKRAALARFEPETSLISTGAARAVRRRLNDEVLESGCPIHSLAGVFTAVARSEMRALASGSRSRGLDWTAFATAWGRIVRRVVLGDAAAEDEALTDLLNRLRRDANWAFMRPKRKALRRELHRRLDAYLQAAEPGPGRTHRRPSLVT